jgi:alpha-L-rhamnosidase
MHTRLFVVWALALAVVSCGKPASSNQNGVLTDPLDNSAWNVSQWISVVDAPIAKGPALDGYKSAPGSNWFLSTVTNEKKVTKAVWMTAGLGVYDLFVNSQLVGKEVLKPGFTHYAKTKRSFTYDITDMFQKNPGEENVLSVQVTPGWWADKIITPGGDTMFGKKCAFRGVLELTYADGTKVQLGTDTENWKAGIAGPVKHAGIFDGEEYDARCPMGYDTPELLKTPEVNTEFAGEILPDNGAEIYQREDLTLHPVRIYVWKNVSGSVITDKEEEKEFGTVIIKREYKDGDIIELHPEEKLVVDFGQNAAAVPSFEFEAAEGTCLICRPSEILNDGNGAAKRGMDGPEGSTHRRNLRVDDDEIWMTYTFGPAEGFVSYRPRTSFWGYRYITVTADGAVRFQSISSVPVTSIAQDMEIGKVETGNELINKLISNTYWGQLSNYLSVPTDCPQRNERLGWMADTQVFTETGTFFANTDRFFHKWMQDVRDSQSETGGYPGVSPYAQYGNEMMRLGWADAGVIVPWTVWKQFGDKTIVDECWDSMEKFMAHVNETKYDHKALSEENRNYNWNDWLSYEALESSSRRAFVDAATRAQAEEYWCYLGACYWALDAGMMKDMAVSTGRDAAKYEAMETRAKEYIRERFLNADGTFCLETLNTMQTPALFALKLNLVEGQPKADMLARLRKNFEDHGNCLQTGFLGTSILMATLTENGMVDMAYELLFQRKNPSWLYSVDNGATTIWERWNSYMVDKGMGPNGMNSFNHYAYGAVCEWIWETAAGIAADPAQPGFQHIIMKPVPDKRLGHLKAEYKSAAGLIKSAWRYEGDTWVWEFTIPKGASAQVTLPGETESKEYTSGTYTVKK